MQPKVVNRGAYSFSALTRMNAVNIMRPTKYGNPFVIGRDGTREQVVEKYRKWITQDPVMVETVKRELKGKTLVCCCKPLPCHGDVLLEIANSD